MASGVLRPPSVQLQHEQLLAASNQRKRRAYPHNDDAQHPCTLHVRGHAALRPPSSRPPSAHSQRGDGGDHLTLAHSPPHDDSVQTGSRHSSQPPSPLHPPPHHDTSRSTTPAPASLPSTQRRADVETPMILPIPTPVTPTPLSAPKSTIASYIHRFRTQPPLDASERAARLLQHHQQPQRDFWWLQQPGAQPPGKEEQRVQLEQRGGGEAKEEVGDASDAMSAIRTTLLPAIERMLKEEGKRIAEQLAASQCSSRPAPQADEHRYEPTSIVSSQRMDPVTPTPLSSHLPSTAAAVAEPSTASLPSATAAGNLLRLAQELHLPGLASLSLRDVAGAALRSPQPLLSAASTSESPFASSYPLLGPLPPSSSYSSSVLPVAVTPAAPLPFLPSLSSRHPPAGEADVDVDDLLAQWRRGRQMADGWPAADEFRCAPRRTQPESQDSANDDGGGRARPRVQEEKEASSVALLRAELHEEELVERVLRRIRAAEKVDERRPITAPQQRLQPSQMPKHDPEQPPAPLHIQVQPPAELLAAAPTAIQLPASKAVPPVKHQASDGLSSDSPQHHSSSLRVDTAKDGQILHQPSASAALPPSSLKTRRRQLSLQLPPHPPRPHHRGNSQPSSSSVVTASLTRPLAPLFRPQESSWIERLPRAPPANSTERSSSVPAATREQPPAVGRTDGGTSTSASVLATPSGAAISSVVARALSCPAEAFARGVHTALGVQDGARMRLQELDDEEEEDAAATMEVGEVREAVGQQHAAAAAQSTTTTTFLTSAPSVNASVALLISVQPTAAAASTPPPPQLPPAALTAQPSTASASATFTLSSSGGVSLLPASAAQPTVFLPYAAMATSFALPATHSASASQPHLQPLPSTSSSSSSPSAAVQWFMPLTLVPIATPPMLSASELRPAVKAPLALSSASASQSSAPTISPSPSHPHPTPPAPPPSLSNVAAPTPSPPPLPPPPPVPVRMTAEAAEDELACLLVEMDAPLDAFEDEPALQSLLHKARHRRTQTRHQPLRHTSLSTASAHR